LAAEVWLSTPPDCDQLPPTNDHAAFTDVLDEPQDALNVARSGGASQRFGGLLGRVQGSLTADGGPGGDDDRDGDQAGEYCTADGVQAGGGVVVGGGAAVDDAGGGVEMNVGADGGAEQRDAEENEVAAGDEMGPHQVGADLAPARVAEYRGHRVGQEGQGEHQEDPLGVAVGAEEHQRPDQHREDRDDKVAGDPDQLERGANAGELAAELFHNECAFHRFPCLQWPCSYRQNSCTHNQDYPNFGRHTLCRPQALP